MDIQSSYSSGALGKALDQQTLGAALISTTLDRLNTNVSGLSATLNPDYGLQKSVLSAYAQMGIGTKIDTMV